MTIEGLMYGDATPLTKLSGYSYNTVCKWMRGEKVHHLTDKKLQSVATKYLADKETETAA